MAGESEFHVRPFYKIECKIGDYDISPNLTKIRIVSTIGAPYQTVILTFKADVQDLTTYDLFGKDDINIVIYIMTSELDVIETIKLTLITVKINFPLSLKPETREIYNPQVDEIQLINLIKDPFSTMTTTVNKLFDETKQLTPLEIVQEIQNEFISNITPDIQKENENSTPCEQVIVPPMTFVDFLRYMDKNFGLFSGPAFFHTRFEDNTFCLWDLRKALTSQEPSYTVYQLTETGKSLDEKIAETEDDPGKFHTIEINAWYSGNEDIMINNYNIKFNSKPLDDLHVWKNFNMEDIFFSNAAISGGKLNVNEIIKRNIGYENINEIGNFYDDNIYLSRLSRRVSSMYEIQFSLYRKLRIVRLARVGVPIEIIPLSTEFANFRGKYIVNTSNIAFELNDTATWECQTTIRAFRGNLQV